MKALRRLFEEIIAEAERRPDFANRLAAAVADMPLPSPQTKNRGRRNKRPRGVVDPFEVFGRGEAALREALRPLSVDQLKDIVSEHAMDSSKLALKWKSVDRLVDLIASTVRARVEKGDAFKRDFVPPAN